jgi:uncharacterized protein DUF262/uncharacterized protein DUF1524
MQAETRTLTQLFQLDVRYLVPLYQRPYVWTEERQWAPLWEDIATVANHLLGDDAAGRAPTHFLGAIVIQQQENPPGTPQRFMVIDGQQRLTTLQLLLGAAARAAAELGCSGEAQLLRRLTYNDPLLAKGIERFKVWPTNANQQAFRLVMDPDVEPEEEDDDPSNEIQEAHHFFRYEVAEWATEGDADAQEIQRRIGILRIAVNELLKLVAIRLEDGDSPQVIFETLNARGTPLIALDLLKNAVFLAAEQQGASTDELYLEHWAPELDRDYWRAERRAGRLFTKNGDLFLSYWLVAELGEPIAATELFETFRERILQPASGPRMDQLIPTLASDAAIVRGFDDAPEGTPERRFFDLLDLLDTTTLMPIALLLHRSPEVADARRHRALSILESFLIRRMVCGWTAKNYNRLSASLIADMKPNLIAADEILENRLAAETAPANRWPTDEDIRQSVREKDMYGQRRQERLVLVLWRIEEWLRSGNRKIEQQVPRPPGLTLEHLIPQTWDKFWPLDDSRDDPLLWRNTHLHKLGNLTLTSGPMNSALSNGPWHAPEQLKDKRRELAHSILAMNHLVASDYPDRFDESSVEERGSAMVEAIVAIWPAPPDSTQSDKAEAGPVTVSEHRDEHSPATVGGIVRGTTCTSKPEFEELLTTWFNDTDELTIGDIERYPGLTTWVRVLTGGHEVHVHADTTRSAVGRYLELVSQLGRGIPWHVRYGVRGSLNKICIEPDGSPTSGLFLYTASPLSAPTDI